ncbi:MAG TPA: BTAD domain-containing putative transcriptional regulator, partial [Anaerolineales bacterium]|nr:BTAD domain-containing putative transcriptional regulator [Anaerolineales bacterium]
MLEIKTLGSLTLQINGHALPTLGSHKAEAIMIYLAVGGEPCNRNVLATLLWPDKSESQALTSLRVALAVLRKDLGDYLVITREAVGINPGSQVYLDVSDLEARLACHEIEGALKIYQGEFLQGFNIRDSLEFEDWRRWQQERIFRLVTSALHTEISNAIEMENYKNGRVFAQQLLQLDPLDELAHRKYILLLALDGQRVDALAQYKKCKAILQAELGVEPAQETQALYTQISQGTRPESTSVLFPTYILPSPQTSFIGRESELNQILSLMGNPDCRLLTLVGPGGVGKTRLALRAATKCLQSFSDGTYFVALESGTSPDYLVPAIAEAIHFKIDYFASQLESKYQLFDYVKNRSILLVLDGFECLVAGAGILSELLEHAIHLKLLVTSRQRLDLNGEWVFPVEGLPVPQISNGLISGDLSALVLFDERARKARTGFRFSPTDQEYAL